MYQHTEWWWLLHRFISTEIIWVSCRLMNNLFFWAVVFVCVWCMCVCVFLVRKPVKLATFRLRMKMFDASNECFYFKSSLFSFASRMEIWKPARSYCQLQLVASKISETDIICICAKWFAVRIVKVLFFLVSFSCIWKRIGKKKRGKTSELNTVES